MKKLFFLISFFTLTYLSAQEAGISLPDINSVKLSDNCHVNIIESEINSISFPDGTRKYTVQNGVLSVGDNSTATIMLKDLKSLSCNDRSSADLSAGNRFNNLSIKSEDVSQVNLTGDFNIINLEAHDASSINISGTANKVDAKIRDAANIMGFALDAKYVKADAKDAGHGQFNKLDVKITDDNGSLEVAPEMTDQDVTIMESDDTVRDRDNSGNGDMDDNDGDNDGKVFRDWPGKNKDSWKKYMKRNRVWSGLELSLGGFSNAPFKFVPDAQDNLMEAEQPSVSIHLNLVEKGFNLGTEYLRFVTGLGFQFDHYRMKNSGVLLQNTKEKLVLLDNNIDYKRNTLILNQFVIPALININTNPGKKNFHIDGGVILGLRFKQKQLLEKTNEYQTETEIKTKSTFHQNPFNIGATARIGFNSWSIFGIYDLNQLYKSDEGPAVHTWHVGLTVVPF